MAIHLVIKGNPAQACRAAADRGISLNQARPHAVWRHDETVARCTSDYRAAVVAWFMEGPQQSPYPIGTLLLFTDK